MPADLAFSPGAGSNNKSFPTRPRVSQKRRLDEPATPPVTPKRPRLPHAPSFPSPTPTKKCLNERGIMGDKPITPRRKRVRLEPPTPPPSPPKRQTHRANRLLTTLISQQTPFRLLDLPAELVLKIVDYVHDDDTMVNLIKASRWIRLSVTVPFLTRKKVIVSKSEHFVEIKVDENTTPSIVPLLSYLPPFSSTIWVEINLAFLVAFRRELATFFASQDITELAVRFRRDDDVLLMSELTIPSLMAALRLVGTNLEVLRLCVSPSSSSRILVPPTTCYPPKYGDCEVSQISFLSLRVLSISMEYAKFQSFSKLRQILERAPKVHILSLDDIGSQEQCDSMLDRLETRELRHLAIELITSSTVSINAEAVSRHPHLQHLTIVNRSDPKPPPQPPLPHTPLVLPPVQSIRLTSHFPSLLATNSSAIKALTLLPTHTYGNPFRPQYCQSYGQFIEGLSHLSTLHLQDVHLRVEFPWRFSSHLLKQIPGCKCSNACEFTVRGVKSVRIVADDESSLTVLVLLMRFAGIFPDIQEVEFDGRWTETHFDEMGGFPSLNDLSKLAPGLSVLKLGDRRWSQVGGGWKETITI